MDLLCLNAMRKFIANVKHTTDQKTCSTRPSTFPAQKAGCIIEHRSLSLMYYVYAIMYVIRFFFCVGG